MDLDFEIEKGGESEQLANGLKESTSAFGKDVAMTAAVGAGSVVASTGINIGVGTTDEIIADNIAAAINLTGEQGLTNLANNLEGYTQQLTAMGLNAPEELVNIILEEITAVLAENGVIDTIKTGLQVTTNTVEFAKAGLDYAMQISTIMGNIQKLLLTLNKMQDTDVMCIPTVKDSLSALTASLINQLKAQYEALKQQLILFYNSMICTSNDSVLDNIVMSVNNILEVIEPALDPLLQQYTGHTLQEVRNICNQGFAYIGMIQRAQAKKRIEKEQQEQIQDEHYDVQNEEKKKLSKEEKEKLKKEKIKKSKQKWKEKTQDLSIEQAREKLLIWIGEQSILIQNAFHILIIKQTVDDIKTFISQLQNTSIENQIDLLNYINDILNIFEDLGLTPDAEGITIDDLKKLGLAAAGTVVQTAVDMGNQVYDAAAAATQEMMDISNSEFMSKGGTVLSVNIVMDTKGTVASISDNVIQNSINGSFDTNINIDGKTIVANTVKNIASNTTTIAVDQTINNVIDAGLNMDMNAIGNGNMPTIETQAFTYEQSNKEKDIYINITLNKNPHLHLLSISSFINSFRSGNGKAIFNNGATKQIKDAFLDSWDANEELQLRISAIVNGITKFYNFIFTINQNNRKKAESETSSEEITNLNLQTDTLIGTGKSLKNKVSNVMGDVENMASSATDNAIKTGKDAMSKLTNVNANIDMGQIEAILKKDDGTMKVLMFDEVVQFLKILQPVVQTLQFIAHLLENWMINKEFIRTKQHVDLNAALKNAAQLVNGLKDIINLNDTNFFIIRTKETSDWAITEFQQIPNEFGFLTINILQTTVLNTYLSTHLIKPDYPLNLFKGTTLYFDNWAIEHGGYNDGTSNGLDNIEINREYNEIYYDSSNRSTISSEILRARKKGIDPKYIDTPKQLKDDFSSIFDAITFESDEIEGKQTLDMCNLDLCSPTVKNRIKSNKKSSQSAVIIEFGDEYTLGNRVEYSLNVKPGQTLNQGDIIAYIKKDGKDIPIVTQYTGVIRSTDKSNKNYYNLYPQLAHRHIIIDNPIKCSATKYDIKNVIDIQQKFKKATELETFIINCMPLSILPSMLANASRTNPISTSYDTYNEAIKQYDIYINEIAENLANNSKNIKESTQTSKDENGISYISIESLQSIKDQMLSDRKAMIEYAITTYENMIDERKTKPIGDINYLDCIGLAYNENAQFKRQNKDNDKIEYNNYYLNLLKSIPETPKQSATININISDIQNEIDKMHLSTDEIANGQHINMNTSTFNTANLISNLNNIKLDENDSDSRIKEFKEIIKNIIDIRLAYEKQSNATMLNAFNEYYRKTIKRLTNPYNDLNKRIQKDNIDKNDSGSILKYIKKDKQYDDTSFDKDKNEVCQQALTLFMYLNNADIKNTKQKFKSVYGIEKTYEQQEVSQVIKNTAALYINNNKKVIYNEKAYESFESLYIDIKTYISKYILDKEINQLDDKIFNAILDSLKTQTPDIDPDIVKHIINAYKENLQIKNINKNSLNFFNDIAKNNIFYQMIKDEALKIEEFWKNVIIEYRTTCNTEQAIKDMSDYANEMNLNVIWPQSININVDNTNYELYTFIDPFKKEKKLPSSIPYDEKDIDSLENAINVVVDPNDIKDIRQNDPITIFDYEYWLVYMLNATLFTLIPSYWADGFDIPPFMTPLLLPAIYLPIAPPVMIPVVNVLMVFGIALRGIWPAPIILMINLTSDNIDVMVFLKIALEIAKDIFKKIQETVENTIPMLVNEMLMGYLDENEVAQKAIEKFRTYSSIIKAIPIENKALIEKEFNEALVNELNKPSKLNDANEQLYETKQTMQDNKRETMRKVGEGAEKAKRKAMNFDRRQVITREADLGNGPTPM